ncbi:MAG: hypothetical protein ACM3UL_00240 [Ignavibacteria bacterium]
MSGNTARKLLEHRNRVNINSQLVLNKELIRPNEKIVYLDDDCLTQEAFIPNIGTLALLIEDFDKNALRSYLKEVSDDKLTNIELLELLFKRLMIDTEVCSQLRLLKKLRNISFPYHNVPTREFVRVLKSLGMNTPFDWNRIWKHCVDIYSNSLLEISSNFELYNQKISYAKRLNDITPKGYGEEAQFIYLNDFLYKYRILVPLDYKYKMDFLVDNITAGVVAYDKGLNSINYALKKYVIPFKKKFTEHSEDWYFVKQRPFLNNEIFANYEIVVHRDSTIIRDEAEFQKYFRYVYASVAAYRFRVSPDWLIKHYWKSKWLTDEK